MYQKSAFKTAFWAGLASPVALFSTPQEAYTPVISGLTVGSAFASVGASLSRLAVMTIDDQEPGQSTSAEDGDQDQRAAATWPGAIPPTVKDPLDPRRNRLRKAAVCHHY